MQTVGIDLVETARIARSLRSDRFVQRVFGPAEQAELSEKAGARCVQSAAAAFAAKEAFLKALGLGLGAAPLREIELVHTPAGQPSLFLSGQANALLPRGAAVSVSLTHTARYAAAVVLLDAPQRAARA